MLNCEAVSIFVLGVSCCFMWICDRGTAGNVDKVTCGVIKSSSETLKDIFVAN